MEIVKTGSTIQSLQIGLGIIDIIAKHGRPLKFTDIQEMTNLSKSNLYKYLNTFIQLQILFRDKQTGTYVLGSKLIEYGIVASDQENVLERITPFLEELNKESASSVTFSIWTENGPMVLKMFNNNLGFNIGVQIGTLLPPTSSAGKIFLAFKDEYIVKDWKEKGISSLEPSKIAELELEVQKVRQKAIAFTIEPIVPSVSSISFPIINFQKSLLGAVAVVGFNEQIPMNEDDKLSQFVINMRKQISTVLGYQE